MKNFRNKIYFLLKKVPKGRVTTYKELAEGLNSKAYRAVGTAMRLNKNAPIVPCHRVVNSNGYVGHYSGKGGHQAKIRLLEKEGVKIKNNKIADFKNKIYKFKKIKKFK